MVNKYVEISLLPYPGVLYFTRDKKAFLKLCKKHHGVEPQIHETSSGKMQYALNRLMPVFVVWSKGNACAVHELSHCILDLFDYIGINPCEAGGEPFCYMIQYLWIKTR